MQGIDFYEKTDDEIQEYFSDKYPTLIVWKTVVCDNNFRDTFFDIVKSDRALTEFSKIMYRYVSSVDYCAIDFDKCIRYVKMILGLEIDLEYAFDWIEPNAKKSLEIMRKKKFIF